MLINQSIIADIQAIIIQAKDKVIRLVDHERTLMYWQIGQRIFEEEQQGKDRADYGDYLTKFIADQLEPQYGSGFSKRQIELFRQFYRTFPIANTVYSQLSWSQYKVIIRLDGQDKRDFYIAEAIKNNWTVRQLERQIHSSLWERLLMSNDTFLPVKVAPEAKQLIDKYRDPTNRRVFNFYRMYSSSKSFNSMLNVGLRSLATKLELPKDLTSYYARHSWGTIARNVCRVSKDDVALALNHVDAAHQVTDIYIEKNWNIIDEANGKVLSLFRRQLTQEELEMAIDQFLEDNPEIYDNLDEHL